MNNIIHNYLNQLRVISLFEEGNKARIEHGFLTIDDSKNWFCWFKRQKWLYPWSLDIDSKEKTVKHLQNFYISISQSIEQIIIEINNNINNNNINNNINNYINHNHNNNHINNNNHVNNNNHINNNNHVNNHVNNYNNHNNNNQINNNDNMKYDGLLLMTLSLLENIILSMKGLINLSNTYKNYPRQYAEIKGIIDDYAKPTIQLLYKNIPKDKLVKLQILNSELTNDLFKDDKTILQENIINEYVNEQHIKEQHIN
jgi:hypothetical protein